MLPSVDRPHAAARLLGNLLHRQAEFLSEL